MTYFASWEEFGKAVEKLWAANPGRCRFVTKYCHADGSLQVKMTDDVVCLQYATEQQADLKRLDKLQAALLRQIVSK